MDQTITLEVARYSPERDTAPRFDTFQVPLRREWVVLDALNYIKDNTDGSLTFRWSCRMGICGSCGMMVNGEPKLTCATFLSDYAPAPLRVEPLRYFPVVRDLVIEMTDFMTKLQKVKPWIIRKEEKPLSEGEYLQTPQHWTATSSTACASTACSATQRVRSMDSILCSAARRPLRWPSAITWIHATKEQRSVSRFSRSMRASGAAPLWGNARAFAPSM